MEISMRADLKCANGEGGKVAGALMNETIHAVTHVVISIDGAELVRRLLPLNAVTEGSLDVLTTRHTREQLDTLPPLDEIDIVPTTQSMDMATGVLMEMPIAIEDTPKGTLVIDKHTPVEASDGHAGSVDAVLLDPISGAITHIMLREGHLWDKRDVTIPLSNITSITRDEVKLNLTRDDVGALPATPV